MKSIKNHVMFILPLLAILLGVESFMVFGRVTQSYGESLRQAYSILVVADTEMKPETFRAISPRISRVDPVEKEAIVEQIARGITGTTTDEIIKALPQFYTLHLDRYIGSDQIASIKRALEAHPHIRRVETFGQAHNANYNLYTLIKITLWTFVGLMVLTSLFLVLKQMRIWQLEHRERMEVMEILGASGMLRSGVLFRIALTDALIATVVTVGLFAFLRFVWAPKSGIAFLLGKEALLFAYRDVAILSAIVLAIVIVSVVWVVRSSGESIEG
jgi:cell division transport system permease protein